MTDVLVILVILSVYLLPGVIIAGRYPRSSRKDVVIAVAVAIAWLPLLLVVAVLEAAGD